ncbi:MAG TPA: nucleoside triphosphate pyrophosphohydrolase [Gammaproteobacteria bacterium]|nr:nucleoside triphosphate pyrophosphohydrolase [Gammaproteobacteria bacterium]
MNEMQRLLEIMARLRDPEQGCPWDREQTFHSIAPYTVEEAYEVADAIEHGDMDALREELGDLLLQTVFHARIAEEQGRFDFADVARSIGAKLIERHPHVFGEARFVSSEEQTRDWEARKAVERERKHGAHAVLDGIPLGLPALTRAVKLQKRAAHVGFDWQELEPVIAKVREELAELQHEIKADAAEERVRDELGDVLFAVANLARKLGIDPEQALRGTNSKFERRFARVETGLAKHGKRPEQATLAEMDAIWEQAKREGL